MTELPRAQNPSKRACPATPTVVAGVAGSARHSAQGAHDLAPLLRSGWGPRPESHGQSSRRQARSSPLRARIGIRARVERAPGPRLPPPWAREEPGTWELGPQTSKRTEWRSPLARTGLGITAACCYYYFLSARYGPGAVPSSSQIDPLSVQFSNTLRRCARSSPHWKAGARSV